MDSRTFQGLEKIPYNLVELSKTIFALQEEVERLKAAKARPKDSFLLDDDLLTVKQVAHYFGCSPQNIYNRIYRGHFKCARLGGRVYIRKSELENL